jgi:hypothetical protein
MALCGVGIGLLVAAFLDRDRKPPIPRAGTLMRGTGRWVNGGSLYLDYLSGDLVVWVMDRDEIAKDQPYLVVDDQWWVQIVTHEVPPLVAEQAHREGERFPLKEWQLRERFTPLTSGEAWALMEQLHSAQETA